MGSFDFDSAVAELLCKNRYSFDDFCLLIEVLRDERGCPWDREQTHKTIRKNMIEEAYEAAEAIDTSIRHCCVKSLAMLCCKQFYIQAYLKLMAVLTWMMLLQVFVKSL